MGTRVELCYSTQMILSGDGILNTTQRSMSLNKAVNQAKDLILAYDFGYVDIIDAATGEVLAIVKKNENQGLTKPLTHAILIT